MFKYLTSALAVALTAAAAVSGAATGPAHAALPNSTTIVDARETGASYDLTRITLTGAANTRSKATVTVNYNKPFSPGDGLVVFFNLDNDTKPDAVLTAYANSEWHVTTANSWNAEGTDITNRGCFSVTSGNASIRVAFKPNCLNKAPALQISAVGFNTTNGRTRLDYAPGQS